nr:hypothetical protein [Thiomonas sp.]
MSELSARAKPWPGTSGVPRGVAPAPPNETQRYKFIKMLFDWREIPFICRFIPFIQKIFDSLVFQKQ